jgi:DNA-binding NtrC family response regulator
MNGSSGATAGEVSQFTVLVVDPDPRALNLTASHVEARMRGTCAITASSYAEARACVQQRKVDFIVFACDDEPGHWEQHLADLSRSCPQAPIALTGRGPLPARAHVPILRFFRKPYQVDDLVAVMESAKKSSSAATTHSNKRDG